MQSLGPVLREQETRGDVFCAPAEELCRYVAGGFLRSFYQFVDTHPDLDAPDVARFESRSDVIAAQPLTPTGHR